ncbi:hypothetical protein LCGC14_1536980 [marine sediment metagenome]|uniref:Uncharacterized protein n=1 Tax=marine sediment metagenome TaxID=412755 RepID=A0A0F9LV09_9ZZZZ
MGPYTGNPTIRTGGHRLRIIRTWGAPHAPTGEGGRYMTEDGRVWRDDLNAHGRALATGESLGTLG